MAAARRVFRIVLLGMMILGSSRMAQAANRFVAPKGTDTANDCLTSASPCRTIQRAVSDAASGDTIEIAKGHYAGPVTIFPSTGITLALSGGWSTDFGTRDVEHNKTAVKAGPQVGPTFGVLAGAGGVADVTFDGLTFIGGSAGAIAAVASDDGSVTLGVSDCSFHGNKSTVGYNGGALSVLALDASSIDLTVADSTFQSNKSVRSRFGGIGGPGGAITATAFQTSAVTVAVSRSRFLRNGTVALMGGGAIAAIAASSSTYNLTIDDSTFVGNTARGNGGAITVLSSTTGAVALTLTNDLLAGNNAKIGSGGGFYIDAFAGPATTLAITNCTVTDNIALDPGGGVVLNGTLSTVLTNAIIWGNQSRQTSIAGDDVTLSASTLDIDHSDIGQLFQNGGTVNDMGGNIDANPLLVNPPNDLHLRAASPCIDAGTCVGAPTTDFEGDSRPSGTSCDIGADEFIL